MSGESVAEAAFIASVFARHPELPSSCAQVPVVNSEGLTWLRFAREFQARNMPVVIRGVAKGWPAARDMVREAYPGAAEADSGDPEEPLTDLLALPEAAEDAKGETAGGRAGSGLGDGFSTIARALDCSADPASRRVLRREWAALVAGAERLQPDLAFFKERFAGAAVSVVDCDEREFNSQW